MSFSTLPLNLPAQTGARQQQQVEELCGAAIRALSGDTTLQFRGRRLHRRGKLLPLFAPHLHPSLGVDDFKSFRGAADGLALRLALSDEGLHQSLRSADAVERLVFDMLEQIRVESLASSEMPGVEQNLNHRFEQWAHSFHRSRLTESAHGILLYTVLQMCRSRVTGAPVLEATEDLIEATRAGLGPHIGVDLAGLRRHRADQAAYAIHALAIAQLVSEMLKSEPESLAKLRSGSDDDLDDSETAAFSLMMDTPAQIESGMPSVVTGSSLVLAGQQGRYQIYTTAYDREVPASALVRRADLEAYRVQLDRRIAGQGVNLPRLARELKSLLARPHREGWVGGEEEGYIDGRRLAQLVASPAERRLFRRENTQLQADCAVGFLIDCSGSMKQHIESVAMMVDVFTRALEMAGVASEVLGYTTSTWNGGRAQRDWLRAGKPTQPGRLNEVCHLVFKSGDKPWRRARTDMAALLRADLFREGIDGEAVDWACQRLQARSEDRKLLIVISDGCPMDGATNLANDTHYLDNHLKDVLARHDRAGSIDLFGVGVALDLSPYYQHSHALDLSTPPGNGVFREIMAMIDRKLSRRSARTDKI